MTTPVLAGEGQTWYVVTSVAPAATLLVSLPLALLASARLGGILPRVREAVRATPGRSFLMGFLVAVALLLLLTAAGASPFFRIPALLALVASAFLVFLGLVAEARDLGCALRDRDPTTGSAEGGSIAVGWLVLAGVPLLFVAGPLVLLYLALRSAGATAVAVATGPAQA